MFRRSGLSGRGMFDDLRKTVAELDGMKLSVPSAAEPDAEGYIDRQCPAEACEFVFKVDGEDWRDIVRDEAVWCPFCGCEQPADQWWTHEQVEAIKKAALGQVAEMINGALRRDAARWNRRQRKRSFISMTMRVDAKPRTVTLPAAASKPMRLKIDCSECGCRFAVIGSAFFCPACGHNSSDRMFRQSLATIAATLNHLGPITAGITDQDAAETMRRLLVEDSLQRIVTAFQRYAEALYARHPNPPKARRNIFQNLADGSALWDAAFGSPYSKYLGPSQLELVQRYFQQRHLLAHCEGLVDSDYVAKTGDNSFRPGQRLVVREASVREFLTLVELLSDGLAQAVPLPAKP